MGDAGEGQRKRHLSRQAEIDARRSVHARTGAPASQRSVGWYVFADLDTPEFCARSKSVYVSQILARMAASAFAQRVASPASAAVARRRFTADVVNRKRMRVALGLARHVVGASLMLAGLKASDADVDAVGAVHDASRQLSRWQEVSSTVRLAVGIALTAGHALPLDQGHTVAVQLVTSVADVRCELSSVTRLRVKMPAHVFKQPSTSGACVRIRMPGDCVKNKGYM